MIPRRSPRYLLLLALATTWILAVTAPVLHSVGSLSGDWLYLFFSPICHQSPDRSFFWMGRQLAVCHRCFGIYLGFWVGILLLPILRGLLKWLLLRPRRILLFVLPMALDVVLDNHAASRFLTGFVAGFPAALFTWVGLEQLPLSPTSLLRRFHEPRAT